MGHKASISSKKIMQGALALALLKTYLTDLSDSPTYLLSNSGPFTAIKFACEAFATAFANIVLPQPGGPYNSTPAGE